MVSRVIHLSDVFKKHFGRSDQTDSVIIPTCYFLDARIIWFFGFLAAATEAEAEALENADDRNAQEEAHQATELSHKLDSILREVVDPLVLERPHVELEDDHAWAGALNGLPGASDLCLKGLALGCSECCV